MTPIKLTERQQRVFEAVADLAAAVFRETGQAGLTRVSVTPDVGLALGIVPGTSADLGTDVGRVEVYCERTERSEGTARIA